MELSNEHKNQLIDQRLQQYLVQKFNLQMDLAAHEANNNAQGIAYATKEIAMIENAYDAVAEMKVVEDATV